MSSEFFSLWEKYHSEFGTWFPTMCFPTDTEEERGTRIKECLDRGLPAEKLYDLNYDSDIVY